MASKPVASNASDKLVFTDQFVQMLESKYKSRPDYHKGCIYAVATSPSLCTIRDEIERAVSLLPELERKKFIARLRKEETFETAYHELVVYLLLRDTGLDVVYEQSFGNVTPDWTVKKSDGQILFFVEVFTAKPPDSQNARQRAIGELWGRLKKLPFGVALDIRMEESLPTPSSGQIKKIVSEVENWLQAKPNPQQSLMVTEGLRFEVIAWSAKFSHVSLSGPTITLIVDYNGLREKIADKVHKYQNTALKYHVPFVVAFVAEFTLGHDEKTVDDVLYGLPKYKTLIDNVTNEILGFQFVGRKNGLFDQEKGVSAVWYLFRGSDGKWAARLYENPKAQIPISPYFRNTLKTSGSANR